jgi:hypothetical protein
VGGASTDWHGLNVTASGGNRPTIGCRHGSLDRRGTRRERRTDEEVARQAGADGAAIFIAQKTAFPGETPPNWSKSPMLLERIRTVEAQ